MAVNVITEYDRERSGISSAPLGITRYV